MGETERLRKIVEMLGIDVEVYSMEPDMCRAVLDTLAQRTKEIVADMWGG